MSDEKTGSIVFGAPAPSRIAELTGRHLHGPCVPKAEYEAIKRALAAHEAREVVRWDCPACGWSTDPTDPVMTRLSAQADHDADDEMIVVECRAAVRALVER